MQKIPHDLHVAHVNLLSPCRFQDSVERQTAAAKLKRFFFATVDDLALLTIRSAVLNQNGIRLIQSYGHFVTSSDKRKRKNEASDEFLGEAKTGLG